MFALTSRKVLFVALLATVLTAPAQASDGQLTTQQTGIGQGSTEMSASDTGGSQIVQQATQTETKAQIAEPNLAKGAASQKPQARQKVTELRPSVTAPMVTARQPSAGGSYRAPLMLGVGY